MSVWEETGHGLASPEGEPSIMRKLSLASLILMGKLTYSTSLAGHTYGNLRNRIWLKPSDMVPEECQLGSPRLFGSEWGHQVMF